MSELLSCPFCGGGATLWPETHSEENPSEVISPAVAKCDECGALVIGDWGDDAEAAWNRRASPPPSAAGEWQTVPKEPTVEMLNAAIDVDAFKLGDISPLGFRMSLPQMLFEKCWRAMLAAAPPPPGSEPSAEAMELLRRALTALDAIRPLLGRPADKVDEDIKAFLASHSKGE